MAFNKARREEREEEERRLAGVSGISCTGVRLNISFYALAAWKRSAKRTANWDFAIAHSLGG
ncbi:hypothetical protein, partial [Rhizobium terrae]|uniref:hypothetical protein n=1 Tax=Rhizobium terrae TaxID=2171756 RepID=UPI0019676BB0